MHPVSAADMSADVFIKLAGLSADIGRLIEKRQISSRLISQPVIQSITSMQWL